MLIADRFVDVGGGRVFDIATTLRVRLRRLPRAGVSAELAWQQRCEALFELSHPAIEVLVDYGVASHGLRFEAFGQVSGTPSRTPTRMTTVAGALSGPTPEARRPLDMARGGGATVSDGGAHLALADLLDGSAVGGVRALTLVSVTKPDLDDAIRRAARQARHAGYLPICPAALGRWPWLSRLLPDRHVVLLGPDTRVMLTLGLGPPRAHLVLVPVVDPHHQRWTRASGAAVVPVDLSGAASPTAGGSFPLPRGRAPTDRAREARTLYGSGDGRVRPSSTRASVRTHRLRHRVRRGLESAARGRRREGVRLLRAAAAGLDRRGDRAAAGDALMSLGRVLGESGRPERAVRAYEAARARRVAEGDEAGAMEAAVEIGSAWLDAAYPARAQAVLRSVRCVAGVRGTAGMVAAAGIELARCLDWCGRERAARDLLETIGTEAADRAPRLWRVRSRVALRLGDVAEAGRWAERALDAAVDGTDARDEARAHETASAVASAAGSQHGLREHIARGLRVARAARAPVERCRLLVALLEGQARLGCGVGRSVTVRALRRTLATLPRLLRGRACRALIAAAPQAADVAAWRAVVRALVRERDVRVLDRSPGEVPRMQIIDDVIEMLAICQDSEDDATALAGVCGAVRERLGALGVWLESATPERRRLASNGRVRTGRSEIAGRVADTGLLVPPVRTPAGCLEAAAPVRHAGSTVAALSCRWSLDEIVEPDRAGALLATAAAACAPSVRSTLDRLAAAPRSMTGADDVIGVSRAAADVRRAIERASHAPFPVLIQGESGSGKELVAGAIHRRSPRRDRRLCALNCAALTDELIEAELFGHARGAFTGALHERIGLFEEADGGTLLLDEVSELSARAQAKLLRVLQEGEVRRVGENFSRRVDVRVVAATNRDLFDDVRAGRFREDLRYRLDVIRIEVPPLRERVEDVALLVSHFWRELAGRVGTRAVLAPETVAALARYDWPGNVRELQNVLASLAVAAPRRGRIGPQRLPAGVAAAATAASFGTLQEARLEFERRYVRAALARHGGHHGRTAEALGLSRQGLAKVMTRLAIAREQTSTTRGETSTVR